MLHKSQNESIYQWLLSLSQWSSSSQFTVKCFVFLVQTQLTTTSFHIILDLTASTASLCTHLTASHLQTLSTTTTASQSSHYSTRTLIMMMQHLNLHITAQGLWSWWCSISIFTLRHKDSDHDDAASWPSTFNLSILSVRYFMTTMLPPRLNTVCMLTNVIMTLILTKHAMKGTVFSTDMLYLLMIHTHQPVVRALCVLFNCTIHHHLTNCCTSWNETTWNDVMCNDEQTSVAEELELVTAVGNDMLTLCATDCFSVYTQNDNHSQLQHTTQI